MSFNPAALNAALDGLAAQVTYIGIHTAVDPGTGTNANAGEAFGGTPDPYARQAVTWGASSGGVKMNTNTLTFNLPAGSYAFYTLWNNSSSNSGNYRGFLPFSGSVYGIGVADSSTDAITSIGHGLVNDDRVRVSRVLAQSIPSGLAEGTLYYVVGATSNTFQLATTLGGSAVNVTGSGNVWFQKLVITTLATQGQIVAAPGALVLDDRGQ